MSDRSSPRFMPTFDEAMQAPAQLQSWGHTSEPDDAPAPQQPAYFGSGKPGPGLKTRRCTPDANF